MTRNEAINVLRVLASELRDGLKHLKPEHEKQFKEAYMIAIEALELAKKREKTCEWCTDCKEYDQENHCCHRLNNVIYDTLCGTIVSGEWIPHPLEKGGMSIDRDVCSVCGVQFVDAWMFNYCPNCGASMKEVEDER